MKIFLREVFSENGVGSFSRVASLFHMIASISWVSHFVWHTHALPDALTLGGISAFAVAPYGANKISNAIGALGGRAAGDGKPSTP